MYTMQTEKLKLENVFLHLEINKQPVFFSSNFVLSFLKMANTHMPNIANDSLYRNHYHLSPIAEETHLY